MIQKMRNTLCVYIYGIDLTKCSNFQFYLLQNNMQFSYVASASTSNKLIVEIPYEDAMKLVPGCAQAQVCLNDSAGNPRTTKLMQLRIDSVIDNLVWNGLDPIQQDTIVLDGGYAT